MSFLLLLNYFRIASATDCLSFSLSPSIATILVFRCTSSTRVSGWRIELQLHSVASTFSLTDTINVDN